MHVNPASLEEQEGEEKKTVMNLQTLANTDGKKGETEVSLWENGALISKRKKKPVLIKAAAAGGNAAEMQSANTH